MHIDFTMSQLQTQQLMTSQIRSHIDYSAQTYNFVCAHFVLKTDEKCRPHWCSFKYDIMMILDSGLLFGPPLGSYVMCACPGKLKRCHLVQ